MRYLSVCSGIEAATVAWHPLGWTPVAFSEVEEFPSAVLAHHYPSVPNLGDMTKFKEWPDANIDVLVGGTPCQSFSMAGLRKGLDDPRGNLMLTFLSIADRYRPDWLVWENVPGVLSSNGGRDFGTLLGGMAQLGYGFAFRVLDARYFGVAQRRRRVFVVANSRDWRRAAAVLFDRASLQGGSAPGGKDWRARVPEASESDAAETSGERPASSPMMFKVRTGCEGGGKGFLGAVDETFTLATHQDQWVSQPITVRTANTGANGHGVAVGVAHTLDGAQGQAVVYENVVRRLTPVECERLQGFPDQYTNIPWRKKDEAPDGPRYKALGNSMAVPCMKWIAERIQAANALAAEAALQLHLGEEIRNVEAVPCS